MAKIFIAEDEPIIRKMYEVKFKNMGFDVEAAEDGEDALNRLKTSRPDLILLDVMMPKVDGFEVLRQLKLNPELKDIRVIILTNLSAATSDREKGIKLGALDFLVKDQFTPAQVVDKVKEILNVK